jgi:hypothetical protein
MKAKVILTNPHNLPETLVGTFTSTVEAFQCASLLQAILGEDSQYRYCIDHKHNGQLRRTQPDNIRIHISNLVTLHDTIKPLFTNL